MDYTNKFIRVHCISGEIFNYHHADMVEEPGSDFVFITVGSKTRKTILIPKSRILMFEVTDGKEEKDEAMA